MSCLKKSTSPALWKLLAVSCIAAFCALLPADALPAMAQWFHASASRVEGILSWYLLGYGIGPLLYGPLSNRFGRKPGLMMGFCAAGFGMLLSLLGFAVHALPLVMVGRLIAGIGASAGLVIGMIMLNETNDAVQARKKYSIIVMFFSFTPALAMALGGTLATHLGLISIFMVMPILLMLVMSVVMLLPETYQGQPIPLHLGALMKHYGLGLLHFRFMTLVVVMMSATAITYVFNGISPLIAVEQLHISPQTFGELAIIPSLGLLCGAVVSARLAERISASRLLLIAFAIAGLSGMVMLVSFLAKWINGVSLLAPVFLLFFAAAIIIPNTAMSALKEARDPAMAASLLNAMALIVSSVVLTLSGIGYTMISSLALPIALLVLVTLGLISLLMHKTNGSSMS